MENSHTDRVVETLRQAASCLANEFPTLVASFIYGSCVKPLLNNERVSFGEIDLLLVTSRQLRQGEAPFSDAILARLFGNLVLDRKHVQQIRNGVAPEDPLKNVLLLDIIGDGLPNIESRHPSSVVTALKPRLLLTGLDVYKGLEDATITPHIREVLFNTLTRYLKREFYERQDDYSKGAIAKNVVFLCSLLDRDAVRENDKALIVRLVSRQHPDLHELLSFFWGVYTNPRSIPKNRVLAEFEKFAAHYRNRYLPDSAQ